MNSIATECNDHRIIRQMNITLKMVLKIIYLKLFNEKEQYFTESKFSFRIANGTREAVFSSYISECQPPPLCLLY